MFEPDSDDKLLLALKAVVFIDGIPQSPSRGGKWNKDGYIIATCDRCKTPMESNPDSCGCGIYATTSSVILDSYILSDYRLLSPVLLVAACGETDVWAAGWKAQAAQAHYIVDYKRGKASRMQQILAMEVAEKYFGIEVVQYEYAIDLIGMSWKDCGYRLRAVSRPRPSNNDVYNDVYNSMSFEKVQRSIREEWLSGERVE